MKYRLWTVLVAAAMFAAGAEGRSVAATAPDVVAIPVQPLPGLEAEPEDDWPPGLEIHGKVVDIESGRPITDFVLQDGSPDPTAPERTIWGSGESHSSPNPEGSLDHTYIEKGVWCRVEMSLYPHPIELRIRMAPCKRRKTTDCSIDPGILVCRPEGAATNRPRGTPHRR